MKFLFFGCFEFKVKEIHGKNDLDFHRTRHIGEFLYSCEIEGCDYNCLSWEKFLIHKSHDHAEGMLEEYCEEKETEPPILPIWTYCDLGNCNYRCLFPESIYIHKKLAHG